MCWSSLCMNAGQKKPVGNKCRDKNWSHCCFPWASLLKLVKVSCSIHLFATGLSVKHTSVLTSAFIFTSAQLVKYQTPASLKNGLTRCTVNELQVIQSRSTAHISCSNRFKYENEVSQVLQRHFCSSPFPVHLPLRPDLPQLIFSLSIKCVTIQLFIWKLRKVY